MRSGLFVPGDSQRKLAKGMLSEADGLFVDLEDSVALDNKQAARAITAGFLAEIRKETARPRIYVRVNAFDTEMTEDDLAAIMAAAPDGIVLPKSEHGQDVTRLDALLRVYEAQNGIEDGSTRIVAIITETAIGTLNAGTYRRSSRRLEAVAWGAEDLSADIGSARRYDDGTYRDAFRFARVQTLLGAVAAGVDPIDTVYPDFRNEAGLAEECRQGKLDGFTAKMAIHPAQVPIINEVYTPSDAEVAKARAIVDAFAAAGNPGVLGVDGQMLDRPHLRKAESCCTATNRFNPDEPQCWIVRRADGEDFQQVLELYGELVGSQRVAPPDLSEPQWRSVLDHPGTSVFCLDHQDQLLGMVTLHILPNVTYHGRPYGLIENVVTRAANRMGGIGRRLMTHAVDHAWSQDCYKIMLLTGKQAKASGFYQKLGFPRRRNSA